MARAGRERAERPQRPEAHGAHGGPSGPQHLEIVQGLDQQRPRPGLALLPRGHGQLPAGGPQGHERQRRRLTRGGQEITQRPLLVELVPDFIAGELLPVGDVHLLVFVRQAPSHQQVHASRCLEDHVHFVPGSERPGHRRRLCPAVDDPQGLRDEQRRVGAGRLFHCFGHQGGGRLEVPQLETHAARSLRQVAGCQVRRAAARGRQPGLVPRGCF
mmetsp:Transcript_45807/g.138871  ORF Transcript_45807/g.138871 Transcript_45807/m.138871 type:complete len:215 (-) Transcript_45807:196-840(-)